MLPHQQELGPRPAHQEQQLQGPPLVDSSSEALLLRMMEQRHTYQALLERSGQSQGLW